MADLLALVSLQMTSAAEHLEGVARVLGDEPMVFVPASVARGVVEAVGRSWWLLDPDLTLDQRVHRALTERLYGIWENSKYPEEVRGSGDWDRKIARILGERSGGTSDSSRARIGERLTLAQSGGLHPRG